MLTADKSELTAEIAQRFPDLHPPFDARQAAIEAHRCLNCFDAPCMGACPTHIDVPRFIKKIGSGNITGSARSILDANVLGASCSRACPVQVLCEGSCVMHQRGEKPIEIGRLQRFAMETYYSAGGRIPLRSRPERPEKIACLGAGPASLACAAELRQQGFQVTIFDRRALPGGLNTYGVAEYKLRTSDSLREVNQVRALGVNFVREDLSPDRVRQIEREHDAVFLGIGLGEMHGLQLHRPDNTSQEDNIVDALEFIASYKSGKPLNPGKRAVVIGAGNTAIDAACAARRLGAEQVTLIYRRAPEHMSAFEFEYEHALRDGIAFLWEATPISFHRLPDAIALTCIRTAPGPDNTPITIAGSEFVVECDILIRAIGQSPLLSLLSTVEGVTLHRGRVVVDRPSGQTTNPRFFAGGDCVNGGREVVDAVADGKRAALGIAAWLTSQTRPALPLLEVPLG